jgi:anthranilate synthase component II
MNLLILDNYDSFTYNLVHAIEYIAQQKVAVFRNDEIAISDIDRYSHIVLSPGPGVPSEAGILKETIATYAAHKKILGVCLGHQAIGEVFGGTLVNLPDVYHGLAKNTNIIAEDILFANLPKQLETGRYHSWVVAQENLPSCLTVSATDDTGLIMAMKHKEYNVRGVQFHPESVLTPLGNDILKNWLTLA